MAPYPEYPGAQEGYSLTCTGEEGTWTFAPSEARFNDVPVGGDLRWAAGGEEARIEGDGLSVDLRANFGCYGPVRVSSRHEGATSMWFETCRNTDPLAGMDDAMHAVCVANATQCPVPRAPGEETCSSNPVVAEGPGGMCCPYASACEAPDGWAPHRDANTCEAQRPAP